MPFDGNPGCFLIRVKGACNEGNWERWPDLIDEATTTGIMTRMWQTCEKKLSERNVMNADLAVSASLS